MACRQTLANQGFASQPQGSKLLKALQAQELDSELLERMYILTYILTILYIFYVCSYIVHIIYTYISYIEISYT